MDHPLVKFTILRGRLNLKFFTVIREGHQGTIGSTMTKIIFLFGGGNSVRSGEGL